MFFILTRGVEKEKKRGLCVYEREAGVIHFGEKKKVKERRRDIYSPIIPLYPGKRGVSSFSPTFLQKKREIQSARHLRGEIEMKKKKRSTSGSLFFSPLLSRGRKRDRSGLTSEKKRRTR